MPKVDSRRYARLVATLPVETTSSTLSKTPKTVLRHKDRQSFAAASTLAGRSGLVVPNKYCGPLDPRNVLTRFRKTLAAAGLPQQRFHDLRHYAATFLVAKGVPIRVVMDILGLLKMATTTDLYGHVMPAAHREVADLIDQDLRPRHPGAENG